MNNWWTEADAEAFKAKTDILVGQFDAIEVLPAQGDRPALMANGSLSLGENIADQGGLRVARTALRNALGGDEPAPIDGFTAAQRFYLAYATLWGQNIRDEEIARLTKLDVHSLGKWRVNATLRNLQDFYDAFGIAGGRCSCPSKNASSSGDARSAPKRERPGPEGPGRSFRRGSRTERPRPRSRTRVTPR